MLKATILKETLAAMIACLASMSMEARLRVTPDGLTAKLVDDAHIAMVSIRAPACVFKEYTAEPCEIGLDIEKVQKFLGLVERQSDVLMKFDAAKGRLTLKTGNVVRHIACLTTATMADPKMPDLELGNSVEIPAPNFQEALRAAAQISDHLCVEVTESGVRFVARGDNDDVEVDVRAATQGPGSRAMYSLAYLQRVGKATSAADALDLRTASDKPLMLNAHSLGMDATFLVAPWIED